MWGGVYEIDDPVVLDEIKAVKAMGGNMIVATGGVSMEITQVWSENLNLWQKNNKIIGSKFLALVTDVQLFYIVLDSSKTYRK